MVTKKLSEEKKQLLAKRNLFKRSKNVQGISIKGYDFNKGVDYEQIIKSYMSTGFQASEFSTAVSIIDDMIKSKSYIFLGYTSNMMSSGLRECFRYLIEHKKVDVVVTTAGGIEEDFVKCLGDFKLGDFRAPGKKLREMGINRIGNIFAPNDLYVKFEKWIQPILKELYDEQKKTGKIHTPSEIVWKLGESIKNKDSVYYWAWKNKIKVFCPGITDGALGDNIYLFQFKNKDFKIDLVQDIVELNNSTIGLKKSGVIILGTGIVKHSILNANMLRNGADYAVYINNSQEFDGSDAGALPEEAISWGKVLPDSKNVKLFADATIVFPLIVSQTFAKK
jgi:deoxyhypusine synthase